MKTVQTLNDSNKMNDRTILAKPFGYPSQKQKRSNATHKPTHGCFTFAFAQRTCSFEQIAILILDI
jgi:hypothetical protein